MSSFPQSALGYCPPGPAMQSEAAQWQQQQQQQRQLAQARRDGRHSQHCVPQHQHGWMDHAAAHTAPWPDQPHWPATNRCMQFTTHSMHLAAPGAAMQQMVGVAMASDSEFMRIFVQHGGQDKITSLNMPLGHVVTARPAAKLQQHQSSTQPGSDKASDQKSSTEHAAACTERQLSTSERHSTKHAIPALDRKQTRNMAAKQAASAQPSRSQTSMLSGAIHSAFNSKTAHATHTGASTIPQEQSEVDAVQLPWLQQQQASQRPGMHSATQQLQMQSHGSAQHMPSPAEAWNHAVSVQPSGMKRKHAAALDSPSHGTSSVTTSFVPGDKTNACTLCLRSAAEDTSQECRDCTQLKVYAKRSAFRTSDLRQAIRSRHINCSHVLSENAFAQDMKAWVRGDMGARGHQAAPAGARAERVQKRSRS